MQGRPSVFVSSTFSDLRYLRAELAAFVESDMGYMLIASEHTHFPVDPALNTIENCRRRVEQDADIFVLVIGNRYGSIPDGHSKSMTAIEYGAARAKRVPIFAFVHRDVLAIIPVWQANPNARYDHLVDSNQLFEFVAEVRSHDAVWTFSFDTGHDIVNTLRTQFAYVMLRGLRMLRNVDAHPELGTLEGEALRIVTERPRGWPGLLFAERLDVALRTLRSKKLDHETGLASGGSVKLALVEVLPWLQERIGETNRLIENLAASINDVAAAALRSGDIVMLMYAADRVAASYSEILQWALSVRSAYVPAQFHEPLSLATSFFDLSLRQVEQIPAGLRNAVAIAQRERLAHIDYKIALEVDKELMASYARVVDEATEAAIRELETDEGTA